MLESVIVAFSMYSKLPMPRIEWNKKNMRYALAFFPLVGVVIGAAQYLWLWLCRTLEFGGCFQACGAVLLPIFITGGIHMDGYLDTIEALSSYAEKEKRLEILKDSNSGAFAIIYGGAYMLASFGIWSEMNARSILLVEIGYVVSRTLSALSVTTFPLAKNTGLAATFQDGSNKKQVKGTMLAAFVAECLLLLWCDRFGGGLVIVAALVSFGFHAWICKKKFGGITGDLAGFFLQVCELAILFVGMMVGKIR